MQFKSKKYRKRVINQEGRRVLREGKIANLQDMGVYMVGKQNGTLDLRKGKDHKKRVRIFGKDQ